MSGSYGSSDTTPGIPRHPDFRPVSASRIRAAPSSDMAIFLQWGKASAVAGEGDGRGGAGNGEEREKGGGRGRGRSGEKEREGKGLGNRPTEGDLGTKGDKWVFVDDEMR